MASTAAAPPRVIKRSGKENNAPPKSVEDIDDSFESYEVEEAPAKAKMTIKSRPTASSSSKNGVQEEESTAGSSSLSRKLAVVTADRDRARSQRDAYAQQFEELSKTRLTDVEALFEKYKKTAALQSQAQSDIIENLTKLNETLQARASSLENDVKAANAATERATKLLPFDSKLEKQDAKTLRDEVLKLRAALKVKDAEMNQLQKEYDAEVKQSRELQKLQRSAGPSSSNTAVSAVSSVSAEESEKDAAAVTLYEDLTGLNILSIDFQMTETSGKEKHYTCCQTVDERSLAFKLRIYKHFDRSRSKWLKMIEFTPDAKALKHERDTDLLNRLGPFKSQFVAPYDQISNLWEAMRSRISRTQNYEEVPDASD